MQETNCPRFPEPVDKAGLSEACLYDIEAAQGLRKILTTAIKAVEMWQSVHTKPQGSSLYRVFQGSMFEIAGDSVDTTNGLTDLRNSITTDEEIIDYHERNANV